MPPKNKDDIPLSSERILRPFILSLLCILLIAIVALIYLFESGPQKFIETYTRQTEELIVRSKKEFIYTAVNRTIQDIKNEEQWTLEELRKENPNLSASDPEVEEIIKEKVITRIRNAQLIQSGYIWINQVVNYDGGDNYAIRLVHPNLVETEGDYLSTNTTDIKGNTPYLTELEGVKENGEIYFNYWFKKLETDDIAPKLTYARLYKKYDWIIATGVYLDDLELLVNAELNRGNKLFRSQIAKALIAVFLAFIAILVTISYFKKRISTTIEFYRTKIAKREEKLREFGHNLQQMVDERTVQLNESEKRYSSIFHRNQSIMLIIDPTNGSIVDANNAAIDYYGYPFAHLTTMKIRELNTLSQEEVKKKIDSVTGKQSKHFYFQHRLASGEVRDVEVYSEEILIEGKSMLFSVIHDISELKRIQNELVVSKEKAERSDRLKSVFLATMSHELRTPLNAVIGFSELIDANTPTADLLSYSKWINKSGVHLLSIIENLFDITLMESGQIKIHLEICELIPLFEEIFEIMKAEQVNLEKEQLSFLMEISDELRGQQFMIDPFKFRQIFINLIKNAFKFTESGFVKFSAILVTKDKKEHLSISVSDSGTGIPANKIETIFDAFRQADESHNRKYGGVGLGLSITQKLVDILGGSIHISSKINSGTELTVLLPFQREIEEAGDNNKPIKRIEIPSKRILVVDDDDVCFSLLEIRLRKLNFEVDRGQNGQEAVDYCRENKNIDLVLMDINMPVMNGEEATRIIKKQSPDIKIIAQTAYAVIGDKEKFLNIGFDDYLSKPIQEEALNRLLSKHLRSESEH